MVCDEHHVTVYEQPPIGAGDSAAQEKDDDDESGYEYEYEYIAATAACMYLVIPSPIAVTIAVNGCLCHISAAHRCASSVLFCGWDVLCNVCFVVYVNLHECAQPLNGILTLVAVAGVFVMHCLTTSRRTRIWIHVLTIQATGFWGVLNFSRSCATESSVF